FREDTSIPLINSPVVIETAHSNWVRRDMSGLCFETAQPAYEFIKRHAPETKLANCSEITALLTDWKSAEDARKVRAGLYENNHWAATTTLPCAKDLPETTFGTHEVVAYGGADHQGHAFPAMYNLDDMALSLMKSQRIGDDLLVNISGVVAWDRDRNVLCPDNIRGQCEQIICYAGEMLASVNLKLSDIVRIRTFTDNPKTGVILEELLLESLDGRKGFTHHVISTLETLDLHPLACEVQLLAAGVTRDFTQDSVSFDLGGARHFFIAPLAVTDDRFDDVERPKALAIMLSNTLKHLSISWKNIVSLFMECTDANIGNLLLQEIHHISGGTFRAGTTASINRSLRLKTGKSMVGSGTAIAL
ncbi:MAG: hypothetical protein KAH24_09020, partial [Holophagae bacterium]|nr:hypothetical protein [Holophagae bacterium]